MVGNFKEKNNQPRYLIKNKDIEAEIISTGAAIRRLCYKGVDVVLGFEDNFSYKDNSLNFGVAVGRNANRIENSCFYIDNVRYDLTPNDGKHNLHGGVISFSRKEWEIEVAEDQKSASLTLFSPDMEEGFPGNASIRLTYTLTNENSLLIDYRGICDKTTVMNLTNHSYFNLNGHTGGDVLSHMLTLNCDKYTPIRNHITTGEISSVENTPFDFRKGKMLKDGVFAEERSVNECKGIDHNFIINDVNKPCALLSGDKTGICMEMKTSMPGIQIYTANSINPSDKYKDGASYGNYNGICLEAQYYPGNLKYSNFPSSILRKGEEYRHTIEYRFFEKR